LLGHLDELHVTQRRGDERVLAQRSSARAGP
jgi:hypothetical protein